MHLTYPETILPLTSFIGKLASTELVLCAEKVGDCCSRPCIDTRQPQNERWCSAAEVVSNSFVISWTAAHQVPLPMGLPGLMRQAYKAGLRSLWRRSHLYSMSGQLYTTITNKTVSLTQLLDLTLKIIFPTVRAWGSLYKLSLDPLIFNFLYSNKCIRKQHIRDDNKLKLEGLWPRRTKPLVEQENTKSNCFFNFCEAETFSGETGNHNRASKQNLWPPPSDAKFGGDSFPAFSIWSLPHLLFPLFIMQNSFMAFNINTLPVISKIDNF